MSRVYKRKKGTVDVGLFIDRYTILRETSPARLIVHAMPERFGQFFTTLTMGVFAGLSVTLENDTCVSLQQINHLENRHEVHLKKFIRGHWILRVFALHYIVMLLNLTTYACSHPEMFRFEFFVLVPNL